MIAKDGPGQEARWARADKDGIGTAYSGGSRIWFTLRNGHLTEVYYPTVDRPQISQLRFALAGPDGLIHDERDDLSHTTRPLGESLGYQRRAGGCDRTISIGEAGDQPIRIFRSC